MGNAHCKVLGTACPGPTPHKPDVHGDTWRSQPISFGFPRFSYTPRLHSEFIDIDATKSKSQSLRSLSRISPNTTIGIGTKVGTGMAVAFGVGVVTDRASAANLQASMLWDWIVSAGGQGATGCGKADNVVLQVAKNSNGIRGVFAASNISTSGELPLLVVPPHLTLNEAEAERCWLAPLWQQDDPDHPENMKLTQALRSADGLFLRLAMLLLCEQALGDDSKFAPYVASLPARKELECVDVYWTREERALLDDPPMANRMSRRKALVEKVHANLLSPGAYQLLPMGTPIPSLHEFKWAVAIITSRMFGQNKGGALVPGVDLINHERGDGANCLVKQVNGDQAQAKGVADGAYLLTTLQNKPIRKGDELLHCYRKDNALGVLPAEEMVRDYGFLPAEKEEAFKCHFYSNPTELTEAFQRHGLMDMEPPDALRMFARNFMADEDKLREAQKDVGPRAVLALKYRQGQHLLLGAQYICFLSNIMGGVQATEDFVKYTIKEHCEGSDESKNAFLQQELMLVDECTKRAAEL